MHTEIQIQTKKLFFPFQFIVVKNLIYEFQKVISLPTTL